MSPRASGTVLPCSEESSFARLSYSFCTSSRNLNMTRARRWGLVAAQPGCAACGIGDGVLDFGVLGESDLGLHIAGIGIENVAEAAGGPFDRLCRR